MKATDVILRDHHAAEAMISAYKEAAPEERANLETNLFKTLDIHERMEDTHFFPALEGKLSDDSVFEELEQEQADLETQMKTIQGMDIGSERDEKLMQALDALLAHAEKEEHRLFPEADEALSPEEMESLGERMEPDSAVANT